MANKETRMIPCKVKQGKTIAIGYMEGGSVNGQPMVEFDPEGGAPMRYVMKGGETASLPEAFFRRHNTHFELIAATVDEFVERESALAEREASLDAWAAELDAKKKELDSQARAAKPKKAK